MRSYTKKRIKNILRSIPILLVLLFAMASCTGQPAALKEDGNPDIAGAFSLSSLSIEGVKDEGFYPGDLIRANIRVVNSSDVPISGITVEIDRQDFFTIKGDAQKIIIDNLEPGQEKDIESELLIVKGPEEDTLASIALVIDRGKQSEHIGEEIMLQILGTSVYERDQIPIIGLHAIEDNIEIPIELYTSHFETLCKTLQEFGFETITFADLLDHVDYGRTLPPKSVIITSDDGFASLYENAFPILKKYGYTMTVFLVTDFVGDSEAERVTNYFDEDRGVPMRPLLIWPEIEEMDAYGIEFLSHSANHIRLGLASNEEFMDELSRSKEAIESRLAKPVELFAWPYDNNSQEKWPLIPEAGYRGAVRYWGGIERISTLDLFEIKRVEFNSYIDPAHYVSYLNLHDIEIMPVLENRSYHKGEEFVLEYVIKNNDASDVVIDSAELTLGENIELVSMGEDGFISAFPGYLEGKYMWVAGGYEIKAQSQINIRLNLLAKETGDFPILFRVTAYNSFIPADEVTIDVRSVN